jgi:hypothetical protein
MRIQLAGTRSRSSSLGGASPDFRARQVKETHVSSYPRFNRLVEIAPAEHAAATRSCS